ncbi:MAG: peptidase-C39 like family protein [Planctomycetota bacterium]
MKQTHQLELEVNAQPNDTTCGPTCLHAVYRYFGDEVPLQQLIGQIRTLPGGGTLAVELGCHALARGYRAAIYTYNLQVFDPTWFEPGVDLPAKLREQEALKQDLKLSIATEAYLRFLDGGGELRYDPLDARLIRRILRKDLPILTGLSATYLYGCAREDDVDYHDVRGVPQGHFVVVSGYDHEAKLVRVADPQHDNPLTATPYYDVAISQLIGAIFLGIVTYDANLLVIAPRGRGPRRLP